MASAVRIEVPTSLPCVSAIGKRAVEIAGAQGRSAFASGRALDAMRRQGCKILFFGVYFVETFVHVAGERARVPYRIWKTFTADFIDQGVSNPSDVEFFARKLDLGPESCIDNEKLGYVLREKRIITSASLGSGYVFVCKASDLVDELTDKLVENASFASRAG
jgi:aminoglycoside N3'-acetyltransferase